jgi:hypothetical protein
LSRQKLAVQRILCGRHRPHRPADQFLPCSRLLIGDAALERGGRWRSNDSTPSETAFIATVTATDRQPAPLDIIIAATAKRVYGNDMVWAGQESA